MCHYDFALFVSNLHISYQSIDGFCVFYSDFRVLTFIAFKSFAPLGAVQSFFDCTA